MLLDKTLISNDNYSTSKVIITLKIAKNLASLKLILCEFDRRCSLRIRAGRTTITQQLILQKDVNIEKWNDLEKQKNKWNLDPGTRTKVTMMNFGGNYLSQVRFNRI